MAAYLNDEVRDVALNYLADHATRLYVCSAQPTTFTEASATYMLASKTIDISTVSPADGDVSGRKLTVPQQTSVLASATGTATHIALCEYATSTLLSVNTCTSQSITSAESYTVPAYDVTEWSDAS